jgi:hypothetical protein
LIVALHQSIFHPLPNDNDKSGESADAATFILPRAVFFAFCGVKEITKHMYPLTHYYLQSFLQSLFITTRKIIGTSI